MDSRDGSILRRRNVAIEVMTMKRVLKIKNGVPIPFIVSGNCLVVIKIKKCVNKKRIIQVISGVFLFENSIESSNFNRAFVSVESLDLSVVKQLMRSVSKSLIHIAFRGAIAFKNKKLKNN